MNKNIGKTDKIIRLIIALTLPVLFLTVIVSGAFGYIIIAIGGILLLTSIIDFCPLYAVLKMQRTKKPLK